MKPTLTLLVILLACGLFATASANHADCPMQPGMMFAQAGPSDSPGFPGHDRAERKHLEQLRMLKLLELLDLREDQELPFLTAFHAMRRQQQQLDRQRRDLLDSLADAIKDTSMTDTEIERSIDRLQQLHRQHNDAMNKFIEEARSILTSGQMARLVIFHERFEYELLKKLRGFRDRMGRGGPPQGPGQNRRQNTDNQ